MCSYYVDIHGKEWIIILMPPRSGVHKWTSSYLYDVENDKFMPFIKNYYRSINKRFNISHVASAKAIKGMSYVIDNDNHILYWLLSSHQRSLLSLDIKNLKNVKLIGQTVLPTEIDGVRFLHCDYTMLLTGDTIQFVLSKRDTAAESLANFQYDIKTHKLSLTYKNIHLESVQKRRKVKLSDLKIGNYIDVKSGADIWNLAKIGGIKYSKYEFYAMSILVHYNCRG